MLKAPRQPETRRDGAVTRLPASADRSEHPNDKAHARNVDDSPRLTAQRRTLQSWTGAPAPIIQRMKIVPYEEPVGGYSSPETFGKMVDVGDARGSEGLPVADRKPEQVVSSDDFAEWKSVRERRIDQYRAQAQESKQSAKSPMRNSSNSSWRASGSSSNKLTFRGKQTSSSSSNNWRSNQAKEPQRAEKNHSSHGTLKEPPRNVQSYAVIVGYDEGYDEPMVLLAEKSVVNRHTTEAGVRTPQEVEMRAPGQLGMPGGKSRPLGDYKLAEQPQLYHEDGLGRLAVESGADEALAETGINVRSKAFETLGFTYARDAKEDTEGQFENERTHAYFLYQGKISELAQRANEVLSVKGAADDEVSLLVVAPLSKAVGLMKETFTAAKQQGGELGGKTGERFVGDGFDWHEQALGALDQERAKSTGKRRQPTPLAKFPDAVKWIGEGEEPKLPEMLQPAEKQSAALSASLLDPQREEREPREAVDEVKSVLGQSLSEPKVVKNAATKLQTTESGRNGLPSAVYAFGALVILLSIFMLVMKLAG